MSKKMLVDYSPTIPDPRARSFVVPVREAEASQVSLRRFGDGRAVAYGLVIYTWNEVGLEELVTRVREDLPAKWHPPTLLADMELFLAQLSQFKLGDIVEIDEGADFKASLKKGPKRRPMHVARLP